MDREVGRERKGVGDGDPPVLEAGRGQLDDVELADGAPLVVAEERDDGRAEARAERGGDLGRVGADDGDVAIVDLEFGLEGYEVPDLARAFRSPVAPVEAHDERKPLGELREPDGGAGVIRQLEIGELSAGDEIGSHGLLLGRTGTGWRVADFSLPPAGRRSQDVRSDDSRGWDQGDPLFTPAAVAPGLPGHAIDHRRPSPGATEDARARVE